MNGAPGELLHCTTVCQRLKRKRDQYAEICQVFSFALHWPRAAKSRNMIQCCVRESTLQACVVLALAREPTVHQSLHMRHDFNSTSLRPLRQSSRDSIMYYIHVQLAGRRSLVVQKSTSYLYRLLDATLHPP